MQLNLHVHVSADQHQTELSVRRVERNDPPRSMQSTTVTHAHALHVQALNAARHICCTVLKEINHSRDELTGDGRDPASQPAVEENLRNCRRMQSGLFTQPLFGVLLRKIRDDG